MVREWAKTIKVNGKTLHNWHVGNSKNFIEGIRDRLKKRDGVKTTRIKFSTTMKKSPDAPIKGSWALYIIPTKNLRKFL